MTVQIFCHGNPTLACRLHDGSHWFCGRCGSRVRVAW